MTLPDFSARPILHFQQYNFSGYLWEELTGKEKARCRHGMADRIRLDNILQNIDVLVDGEFQEDKKNIMLEFRGSENQRIIDVKKTLETGEVVLVLEISLTLEAEQAPVQERLVHGVLVFSRLSNSINLKNIDTIFFKGIS